MKTLIVDDQATMGQLLAEILRNRGHELTICQDSETAWRSYQKQTYPLVLIDLNYPSMDSLRLCRQIRSLPQGEISFITILTQSNQPEELEAILDVGADDYIILPVDLPELSLRLRVAERQVRHRLSIQQLLSNLLPSRHCSQEMIFHQGNQKQHEFIILAENLSILETSSGVQRFADSMEEVFKGNDIRRSFPELIGIEDNFRAILRGDRDSFELSGIARTSKIQSPLYFDLSIGKYQNIERTDFEGLIICFYDVTSKMILEQKLNQRTNELQLLIDKIKAGRKYLNKIINSIADILLITDINGEIKLTNQAALNLFKYTEREIIGESIFSIVANKKILNQAKMVETFAQKEVICQSKTGEKIAVAFSCAAIETDEDTQDFVYIGRDITERKRTIAEIRKLNTSLLQQTVELEKVNQELEAFSQTVSHDLRTPLSHISFFNQMLREEYSDRLNYTGVDYIDQIQKACDRMGQMIQDLLQLSRIKSTEMKFEQVDLSALSQSITDRLKLNSPQRTVEFIISPTVVATGDKRLLEIALENLLGNAWKYTSKKDLARIEFGMESSTTNEVVYFIRDNGAGFNMDKAEGLFRPFVRLHNQSEFPGTGIGLTTVQRIIERHGGRIWATAVREVGATIYFTLC